MSFLMMNLSEIEGYTSVLMNRFLNGSLDVVKRLVIALLIWFIGKKIIKLLVTLLTKTFNRTNLDVGLEKFLISLTRFILNVVLIVTVIGALGVQTTSFITLIGSLGLTIGLSLQGSLSNFAGGVLILLFKPFKVGDYIVACGTEGSVQVIDLLYTKLFTVDNKMVTIPNGTLANSTITNVAAEPERRVDVSIDVSYSTDLKKAKEVMRNVIDSTENVLVNRDIVIFVDNLGDSGITLTSRCWVKTEHYWTTLWALKEKYKNAFDDNGISIPFPQMDVHITQ